MKNKKLAFLIAFLLVLLVYFSVSSGQEFQEAKVKMVIDGDTIILENNEYVRLIGINAPEKNQFYYKESKEKLRKMVENKTIFLEKDKKDRDRYGRLLRYVYLNKTNVNLYMILNGYAVSYEFEPNKKYSKKFKKAEEIAKSRGIGVWTRSNIVLNNKSIGECLRVVNFNWDAEGNDNKNLNDEYVSFQNVCNAKINLSGWSITNKANKRYVFKNFEISPNENFTLYSGKGMDNKNSLFWGRKRAVWINDGDILYLRDNFGGLVIEKSAE